MKLSHELTAAAIAITMGAGLMFSPISAQASEEGRKNTAIALGATALALLATQHNKLPGIVAAVGAGIAYKNYQDRVDTRHRWERNGYYDYRYDRYGSNDRYGNNDRYDHNGHDWDRYDRNGNNHSNRNDRDDRHDDWSNHAHDRRR